VTVWGANTFDTPQNLETEGLAVGDKYQLRACKTISDIFGADNSAGLPAAASSAGSAVIWIQDVNETSGFAKFYYNTGGFGQAATWKKINAGASEVDVVASSVEIVYVDAIFVQMPSGSTDMDIVITGAVKVNATSVVVDRPFNYISGGFPVGSTLQNSGLENSLSTAASAAGSDIVWIQQVTGAYNRYYYNTGGFGVSSEWKQINSNGSEVTAPADVDLLSAIIIQKNGADVNALITPGYNP